MPKLWFKSEKDIVSHKTLDPARKIDPENVLGKQGIKFQQFLADVYRMYVSFR